MFHISANISTFGFILLSFLVSLPHTINSIYVFISCLLLLQFMSTYTYSSQHVNEGFVIVAQGDGLMAIGCQCGMGMIVACVAVGCQCGVGMIVAQGEWLMTIGCQCGVGAYSRLCGHGY